MDDVERWITVYREASSTGSVQSPTKARAIEALAPHAQDRRVLDFLLGVVADQAEYDMARLQVLKLLEANPCPDERKRIGECVADSLLGELDWVVRCWLARAVGAYSDVRAARLTAIDRALDPDEDEDVRHNCLAGLSPADPESLTALRRLVDDEILGSAVREKLSWAGEPDEPSIPGD